jgi:HTH-type transcriptional regulator / antitoxin HipB
LLYNRICYAIIPEKEDFDHGVIIHNKKIPDGMILSPADMGNAIRTRRKSDNLTQAEAAALCGVGTRFLGELERGKETAQIGKVFQILKGLGLELHITSKGVRR